MEQFKQGDAVRTKGGGPNMTVDGYAPNGEVTWTYRLKGVRKQENLVEATLELVPPDPLPFIISPRPRPF